MTFDNKKDEVFPVDEDDTDVMVTITLDDDKEMDCEILVIYEVEGSDYIALMPVDKGGNPIEELGILIYRYFETQDGTPVIENIEDDDEVVMAVEAFNDLLDEDQ